MAEGERSGCLKGCLFGCLGVLALLLLGGLVLGVMTFTAARTPSEQVVETSSQELPGEGFEVRAPAATASAEDLADADGALAIPTTPPVPRPGAGRGTFRLDLRMGEFVIRPADDTESFAIDADYDRGKFRLIEDFSEDGEDWTYTVRFEPKMRFFNVGRVENRVEILVPRGRLMDIVGEIKMGESEVEIGGLWVETLDLDLGMGEHTIRASETTTAPLEAIRIEGGMGATILRDIGNASPATIRAEHSMGELRVDLGGQWSTDSTVFVSCRMGECDVDSPSTAHLVTEQTKIALGEKNIDPRDTSDLPAGAPTVRLSLKGSMGEIRID